MDEPWIHRAKWKKPGTKERVLYGSIYIKLQSKQKLVVSSDWGKGGTGYDY